jgi:two-component system, cell cycle sensor histidine kinase and response regulator CckA
MLYENEYKFQLLYEKSMDPILFFEEDVCVDCNDAALKIMSCKDKEMLLGLSLSNMSPALQPDGQSSFSRVAEIFKEAADKGKIRFEWFCQGMNEEKFWIDITCMVISRENKQTFCTIWRNITKEKASTERLKQSEEKFKIISYSGHDGIILMDNKGNIDYVNQAAERMLGYAEEDILGKPVAEYFASDNFYDAQKLQMGLAEAIAHVKIGRESSGTEALELIATKKDGKEIVVELSLFSEIVSNQLRIIGIFRDVTERKKTIEALQRSETKYRRLFEETKDVVFLSTPEGQFIDINKAGIDLFGYDSREEMLKINIPEDLYWGPGDRKDFKKAIEGHGFVKMYEMAMRRKDGQKVIVSITANAVYDEVGNVATYQGIMRDLTEVKRLEGQLFEFQKLDAVGRMIGDIAHNYNNILNIIVCNAQLARMSGACKGDAQAYLSSIENEVFRAADIVEQLLVFGKRARFSVNIADINDVVRDFAKTIREIIGENIETRTIFAQKPPRARIDVARMNQVLLNLVLNARDAMSGKGTLTIEVAVDDFVVRDGSYPRAKPGKYVVLSVSDTGAGIDEETIKNIFEPFFTTHSVEEKKGLGLSVVYGIVKQHGGFIDVLSRPGQGARFQVFLPLVSEWIKMEKVSLQEAEGGTEAILIAEDEAALRDITAHILRTLGYKVFSASDGVEAVALFRENAHEIDIVILDVAMPEMNGHEAYREIQAIKAGTPVIFMTGYSLDGVQTNFILEEGYDVIQKPFTLVSLGKKIRDVLNGGKREGGNNLPIVQQ